MANEHAGDQAEPSEASLEEFLDRAQALENAGQLGEAIDIWDQAVLVAGNTDDTTLVERIRLATGRCKGHLGAFESAEEDLSVARSSSDQGIAGEAARLIATLRMDQGDTAGAEQPFRDAMVQFDQLGSIADQASIRLELGECLGMLDRPDEALDVFEKARGLYRSIGRGLDATRADDRIAAALINLGRLPEALDRIEATTLVADATGEAARIAYAKYRMGWTLLLADEPEEALPWLGAAAASYREVEDLVGAANCDEKAAQAFSDLGNYERAATLYLAAIAVFEAFGSEHAARMAECNLANDFSRQGRFDEAAARRERILDRVPESDEHTMSAVTVRLADDLLEIGNADQALKVLEEVAGFYTRPHGDSERALYCVTYARALLAVDRISSAREEAERVLAEFDRTVVPDAYAGALEVAAECERRTGSTETAERLLAQAVALYLAVEQNDKASELSSLLLPDDRPRSTPPHDDLPGYI